MGRLLARVREAEERLAGLTRALQSAWEEELSEAAGAREAAATGRRRAEAMEQAAGALGRDELTRRLREVVELLRSSEEAAATRVVELEALQASVGARLEAARAPRALPGPAPEAGEVLEHEPRPASETGPTLAAEPAPAVEPVPAPAPAVPAPVEPAPATPTTAPVAAPAAAGAVAELRRKQTALGTRLDEIRKVAPKLPRTELAWVLREQAALVRLLDARLSTAGAPDPAAADALLSGIREVAEAHRVGSVFGTSRAEFADWNRAAMEARAERQALATARQKGTPGPV